MKIRRTRFISPLGISLLSLAFPAEAIQKPADAESEGRSLIATGRIGPSRGGRTASRILVTGAVSARACIRQIRKPAARTDNSSQTTYNRPPAEDPLSRQWAN